MVEIVAEIAQGFEGRPEQARLLMRAAATAGADSVKYQLVYADELATPGYKYYELFRSLEMDDAVWFGLASYAKELGIRLDLDVFGPRSLHLAERVGVNVVKLHGTDIANLGFLEQVKNSSVPRVLLGAGGAHLEEIECAIEVLQGKEIVILLGFQGYPTPTETNQIARVRFLAEQFQKRAGTVSLGFADHADPVSPLRLALAATAVGAGAVVIEKHLTLGRAMKLEDYESALNPDEFSEFADTVRCCAAAFGSSTLAGNMGMSDAEIGYRKMIRRHVIAAKDLSVGAILSPADVSLKRSAIDSPITDLSFVYGKSLVKPVRANTALTSEDFQ